MASAKKDWLTWVMVMFMMLRVLTDLPTFVAFVQAPRQGSQLSCTYDHIFSSLKLKSNPNIGRSICGGRFSWPCLFSMFLYKYDQMVHTLSTEHPSPNPSLCSQKLPDVSDEVICNASEIKACKNEVDWSDLI